MKFLMFRLSAPMVSWGGVAMGSHRPSLPHPTKSAIMGLVSAALGLSRCGKDSASIAAGYGFAVRIESPGAPMTDYHTVQTPQEGKCRFTRAHELNAVRVHTVLSTREYFMDADYTVALWDAGSVGYSLEQIAQALERPAFVLYLGRKSCPPSMPLAPKIVDADSLRTALEKVPPRTDGDKDVYWEDSCPSGLEVDMVFERRDAPISKRRWQFGDRLEKHAVMRVGG